MVTKKELEEKYNLDIIKSEKEIIRLEKEHEKFKSEDEEDKKRVIQERRLTNEINRLESKKFEGNFENHINWYNSRVPERFRYNDEDLDLIVKALKKIMLEKLKIIKESEEYKKLNKEYNIISFPVFSEEHRRIHDEIEEHKRTIGWNENKIKEIQTRSGLLKVCKWIKENERREETQKIEEEKIKKYKNMILGFQDEN